MSQGQQKTLWITSIQPYKIEGDSYISTSILFDAKEKTKIGNAASREAHLKSVNTNFKLNLGEHSPGMRHGKQWPCHDGEDRTAYELSKIFIDKILEPLEEEIKTANLASYKIPAKILVAEPLNFSISKKEDRYSKTWMQNYRENIRRILSRYEEVEFLPEPFAVYQYYRYGQRIPSLQDKSKHIALVLDFGGGTFDACVIKSTKQGDISLTGKHSKPLAADSCPTGGFEINYSIAEYLIKKNLDGSKRKEADSCLNNYRRVKQGDLRLSELGQKKIAFIENFKRLEAEAEKYKIQLSSAIKNWSLGCDAYERITIKLPKDPFSDTLWVDDEFYAHQFRKVFEKEIWEKSIKRTIVNVFKIANEELNGEPITVTLISGGSSNIKWFAELLGRDFSDELEGATPVPISHSFQEVVANGLAIECARRFYEENSEFVSVTYNPIKLHLRPDLEELPQTRCFTSVGEKIDMAEAKIGDLMPSAQALHNFIDQKLQWRIKLSKSPKTQLRYTFFKPGLEEQETEGEIYNLENQVVFTRDNKHFDSSVIVELVIAEDGTVTPSFIYKQPNIDNGVDGNIVSGRPFAIDMTTGNMASKSLTNYVGFDFGSSCSSLCILSQENVAVTASRAEDQSWLSLNESLTRLPYPVAYPLRKYLDVRNKESSATVAREAFEAALAFLSYTAMAELYSQDSLAAERIAKGLQHRSMGPLKGVLIQAIGALGAGIKFSEQTKLFLAKSGGLLDKAIAQFTDHKHEKLEGDEFNYHEHLLLIVNVCNKLMSGKLFGYVTDTEQKPFEDDRFFGLFKVAHDIPPFTESHPYESDKNKQRSLALLLNVESGETLPLFPFLFWNDDVNSSSGVECYWFDKIEKNGAPILKPCDKKAALPAADINEKLTQAILAALSSNSKIAKIFSIELKVDTE